MNSSMPAWYPDFLASVATHVTATDDEPLLTNWSIGHEILRWQTKPDWTNRVIAHLSTDLKTRYPTRKGLSPLNLNHMRAFARAWPHEAYARGALAGLSWHHHLTLLQKLDNLNLRLWYAKESVERNWTLPTLKANLTTNLRRSSRRPS